MQAGEGGSVGLHNTARTKDDTMRFGAFLILTSLTGALIGCVKLQAPDKPIEINLNVNIRQEVVIRLEQDVKALIENNPGIF